MTKEARTPAQAMAFYVLTEAGKPWPENAANALYAGRDKLGVTGQAYLALALGISDSADRRVKSLLDNLRGMAEVTGTGAHWEEANSSAWVTDIRATAVVLDALTRLSPKDALIPQATRWLMVARKGDRWTTTQETAWALIALTDVMAATGELNANYSWGVALNGVGLSSGQANSGNIQEVSEIQLSLSENPAQGLVLDLPNALEIARGAGAGQLYYSAHLALYQPVADLAAESRGITVQRQYCKPVPASETQGVENTAPCVPFDTIRPGDLIQVRLTVVAPQTRYFLILEDPYPAGMEPVDLTLLTEQQTLPEFEEAEGKGLFWGGSLFDHQELRDDRAVFSAQALGAGTYQVSYYLRAAIPGTYNVLPAQVSEMYFPEVWGRTAGEQIQVLP